ncbi:MAG: tetratricopeptide repeat protein [Flammeovirgaceae bacterium]
MSSLLPIGSFAQKKKDKHKSKEENTTNQQDEQAWFFQEDKEDPETLFLRGLDAFVREDFQVALSLFLQTEKIQPQNAAVSYQIAETYVNLNQADKAIPYAQKAVDLDKKNPYYYLLLAEAFKANMQISKSIEVYKSLIANIPDMEEYYIELASAYLMNGKYKEAIDCYNQIDNKFGVSEITTKQKQRIYLQMNDLESAIKEGNRFLNQFPEATDFGIYQIQLLMNNNKWEDAKSLLDKLIKESPDNGELHLLMSSYYAHKGDWVQEKKELKIAFKSKNLLFERKMDLLMSYFQSINQEESLKEGLEMAKIALEVHPESDKANALYADFLLAKGDYHTARKHYLIAIQNNTNNFEMWQQIISLDWQLFQFDSMVKHSDEALESFPNQPRIYLFKGAGHFMLKQYKDAMNALEQGKLLTNDSNILIEFNEQLGDVYNQLEMFPESDAAYEEVLKIDPFNTHVLNNYSYYLSIRKEKLEKAKEMAIRLIAQEGNNSSYLDTYGWVLYQLGEYEEALKQLEKAIKNANSAIIFEHYGDILYKLGRKEEALIQWQKAKNLGGDHSQELPRKLAEKRIIE